MLKRNTERERDLSEDVYRIKRGRKDIEQEHGNIETEGTKGIDKKNNNTLKHIWLVHVRGAVKKQQVMEGEC